MKRAGAIAFALGGVIISSPAGAIPAYRADASGVCADLLQVQMSGERSGVHSGIRPGMQTGIRPGYQPGYAGTGAIPGGYGFGPNSAIASGVARGVLPPSKTNPMVAGQQPAPGYCWYYTNRSRTRGFWDVCPDRAPRRN
ncbi:hypothetical protein [Bradyrhizobium sp. SYSU BS000235]|uniref:hypothetical protein n=1 Tax=Bradyrhizobium sp. SYSU BS000235 TaxID=3411332 RepID=UPI003C78A964